MNFKVYFSLFNSEETKNFNPLPTDFIFSFFGDIA